MKQTVVAVKMNNAMCQHILAVFAISSYWMCCFETVRVGYVCFTRLNSYNCFLIMVIS